MPLSSTPPSRSTARPRRRRTAKRLTSLLRRLHIWVGLFNLTILVVFGLTGIYMTVPHAAEEASPIVHTVPYAAPGNMTDKEVADDVWERLQLPFVERVPAWAISHDEDDHLRLVFGSPRGSYAVTVLEPERLLRIEEKRSSAGEFLDSMHTLTRFNATDLRLRLWAWYVLISIASLLFMAVTGVWLWLASRPRLWWAQLSLAAGSAVFALLWLALR